MSVPVTFDMSGNLKEDSQFVFTSPLIVDKEGHDIKIEHEWISSKAFAVFKAENNQFRVEIDRRQVTKPEKLSLKVKLGDQYLAPSDSAYDQIDFLIEFSNLQQDTAKPKLES